MLKHLIASNIEWARKKTETDKDFFKRLVNQQNPDFFWIGCSDSRVPANEIVGLDPGEMFVHRNVANQAPPQDANYLSVLHYAVNILKVKHVLVVGHYGCGGVKASIESKDHGLIDHWLSPIREIAHNHHDELSALNDTDRVNRLVELNVIAQVRNVASNPITQNAWRDNRELHVHGWVYALHDGLIKDLGVSASNIDQRRAVFGI